MRLVLSYVCACEFVKVVAHGDAPTLEAILIAMQGRSLKSTLRYVGLKYSSLRVDFCQTKAHLDCHSPFLVKLFSKIDHKDAMIETLLTELRGSAMREDRLRREVRSAERKAARAVDALRDVILSTGPRPSLRSRTVRGAVSRSRN